MPVALRSPTRRDAQLPAKLDRLFWRAGFGPSARDRRAYRAAGYEAAVQALLHPSHPTALRGPRPYVEEREGRRGLRPKDRWGDDVLWWLDRMVRCEAPLVERMTLNLHDHFATSNAGVGDAGLMIRQNWLLRRHALGNFGRLAVGITHDWAMQRWLDLAGSRKESPNENFARELMELFTIGTGYSERDVREASRALTGFTFDYRTERFGWDPDRHDDGVKVLFGRKGRWGPDDVVRLCLEHRNHAPFLCRKVWSWFSPVDPPQPVLAAMVRAYTGSGRELRPVLGIVLRSPAFLRHLDEPDMVKSPVVFLVGAMRATGTYITSGHWAWLLHGMGQAPFSPPNVDGWPTGERWLSTGTLRARFTAIAMLLREHEFKDEAVPHDETAATAMARARAFAGDPWISAGSLASLRAYARRTTPRAEWDRHTPAERRRVLRHLLLAGPDAQVH